MRKLFILFVLLLTLTSCNMSDISDILPGKEEPAYTIDMILGKTYEYTSISAVWADGITDEQKSSFVSKSGEESEEKYLVKLEVNAELLFELAQGFAGKSKVKFDSEASCVVTKDNCTYTFDNGTISITSADGNTLTFYVTDENTIYKLDDSFVDTNGVMLKVIYKVLSE